MSCDAVGEEDCQNTRLSTQAAFNLREGVAEVFMKFHHNYYFGGLGGVGVFFLRLAFGVALMSHGWSKIQNPFGWMSKMPSAPPGFLQALAAVSEFGGGLALVVGLLFPLACFGIMCTMFVAILTHKLQGQPFVSLQQGAKTYEDAGIYFVIALAFFLLGPGRVALDALLFKKHRGIVGGTAPFAVEPV